MGFKISDAMTETATETVTETKGGDRMRDMSGLSESLRAELNESAPEMLSEIVMLLKGRHGEAGLNLAVSRLQTENVGENPFVRGVCPASQLPKPQPILKLWFGLYPRSVCLFIGETGAGKSSLLYNIAVHAALNLPLFDIPFGTGRPLRTLYIDPENSGNFAESQGGQCAVKLERIGMGKPEGLVFHDGTGVNLKNPAHCDALERLIRDERFDLAVLDPIANLFDTKDENDNSEAVRQMSALRKISRATGACIVAVHHTGKDPQGGLYGRGASSRLGAADVGMVFRCKSAVEEDDTISDSMRQRHDPCRLQIGKNRLEGRGSLYLKMAGDDRFDKIAFSDWKSRAADVLEPAAPKQARREALHLLRDAGEMSRQEILSELSEKRIGINVAEKSLTELAKEGVLLMRVGERGKKFYCLNSPQLELRGEEDAGFPPPLRSHSLDAFQ